MNKRQGQLVTPQAQAKGRVIFAMLLGGLALALMVGYWLHQRQYESTDDAFIDGNSILISSRVAGTVKAVHFADNQMVKQGDLLIAIEDVDFGVALTAAQAALNQALSQKSTAEAALALTQATANASIEQAQSGVMTAKAQVAQARVESARAQADAKRYRTLFAKDEVSKQQHDLVESTARSAAARVQAAMGQLQQAQAVLTQAQTAPEQIRVKQAQVQTAAATVEQATAQLQQAQLNQSYTQITAPHTGRIVKKNVAVGALVQPGQSLTAIVYDTPWVVANFKETQLEHLRAGQPVQIEVDAYPGVEFAGHIESIQLGTGAHFSLLPPENATGNFVKVVQRVPVKIVFDEPPADRYFIALGMSVHPRVKLTEEAEAMPTE